MGLDRILIVIIFSSKKLTIKITKYLRGCVNEKKELLLLCASIVFSIIIAEVILRGYYYYTFIGSINDIYEVKPGNALYYKLGYMIRPSQDWKIVYELKPNLDYPFSETIVKTNANGWKDNEFSEKKRITP